MTKPAEEMPKRRDAEPAKEPEGTTVQEFGMLESALHYKNKYAAELIELRERYAKLEVQLAERESEWTARHYADASEEGYRRAKREDESEMDAFVKGNHEDHAEISRLNAVITELVDTLSANRVTSAIRAEWHKERSALQTTIKERDAEVAAARVFESHAMAELRDQRERIADDFAARLIREETIKEQAAQSVADEQKWNELLGKERATIRERDQHILELGERLMKVDDEWRAARDEIARLRAELQEWKDKHYTATMSDAKEILAHAETKRRLTPLGEPQAEPQSSNLPASEMTAHSGVVVGMPQEWRAGDMAMWAGDRVRLRRKLDTKHWSVEGAKARWVAGMVPESELQRIPSPVAEPIPAPICGSPMLLAGKLEGCAEIAPCAFHPRTIPSPPPQSDHAECKVRYEKLTRYAKPVRPAEIVNRLREQFYDAANPHRWEMGDPKLRGDDCAAVYEVYPDGDRSLFARFDSSSDAETICEVLNAVTRPIR
jgi:hypothetical protein